MATNGSTLLKERAPRETAARPTVPPSPRGPFAAIALSALAGALMIAGLIAAAGPWALLANTRVLNLLIGGGVVKYHDRHAGWIEGIPNHEYYVASQDPINWVILGGVVVIYLLIWGLKAVQFHHLARYYGINGGLGRHARSYFYGLLYHETMPFRFGDAAAAAALRANGAPIDRTRATLFLFNTLVLFELAVFAIVALLGLGWAAWLTQVFWAAVILGVLWLWVRPAGPAAEGPTRTRAALAHLSALARRPLVLALALGLSLLSFGLRDVAAYLTAMGFTTQNVLLNIAPSLMLMGVVSGYVATLVRLTPGGIGQFEWGFAAALFIGGTGLPEAATVALLVSALRYTALLIVFLTTLLWRGARASYREVLALLESPAWRAPVTGTGSVGPEGAAEPAPLPAQATPDAALLWSRGLSIALIALGLFFLDRISLILADRWMLESVGLGGVFSTNFAVGAALFAVFAVAFAAAVAAPALLLPVSPAAHSAVLRLAVLIGLVAGYLMARQHHTFLLYNSGSFGEADPVFGRDIGFYVFNLPALWSLWAALAWMAGLALLSAVVCAALARPIKGRERPSAIGVLSAAPVLVALGGAGLVTAAGIWLSRFDLLFKDNYQSSIPVGAEALDVTGLLSTRNQVTVTALAALGVTAALIVMLRAMGRNARRGGAAWSGGARTAGLVAAGLVALDLAFAAGVAVRDATAITPNQPVVQLPYIERHIEATRAAFGLDTIEEVELRPRSEQDPLPDLERLLSSPTVRNAPLWPTFATYLERLVDPQHAQRVLQTGGDNLVYGPTAEIFRQEQKLRTYYNFLDVDVLRFPVDGETRVFASAVRETPILEPQPWLAWWGQRFMLFTHGHGLVMAPVSETTPDGAPRFTMRSLPVEADDPNLAVADPRIYYGEGSASMAISNVRDVQALDYPTDQGRAVTDLGIEAGVALDSPLKRLVFAWQSGEFFEMLLSGLITPETRLHYYRQPIDRLQRVAPFLYFDSNAYATIADGRIVWIANGLTTSDRYPYSSFEDIGDKSQSRTARTIDTERINYVEDSVKATLDAATGQVRLYKIADSPVVNAWARVYPGLFHDGASMPAGVRQQLTYPLHLFHTQFDDLYIYYHMDDPMYYFNMEDMWDDADEVLGPILDEGKAITFSIEPQHLMVETGGALPASSSGAQFALMAPFTPEGARNLRAVPMAYQDGEDYGRLAVLMVPKGEYVLGPEQADSVIDQEPDIAQQISWWNRKGTEVIRGHTTLMLVDNEVIYIEPIFIRSKQNPVTQLKRVVAVVRGHAYMDETLEGALRMASEDLVARGATDAAGGE